MIPLQLKLTNFLSYRDTVTVDLTEVHLACISGANGAGKSSLLDAMTWTLFGKSRSRSDDDLVNRQAALAGEAAEVEFTFNMEGAVYRVVRRKQPQKTTILELQVAQSDGDNPGWMTLTEGKMRETQAAVERVLRMNYDIFTNASFFLQGQADEFTTKTPNQRKEILADVLGVTQWEQYREAAAQRRREAQLELAGFDRQLEEIEAELAEAATRQSDLMAAEKAVAEIRERLQAQQQLQEQVNKNRAAADRQKDQLASMAANLNRLRNELGQVSATLPGREGELVRLKTLLDDAEAIGEAYAAWQHAESDFARWQDLREAYLKLQQERQPHERAIASEESRLRQERTGLLAQQERLAGSTARREELASEKATLAGERERLETKQNELAQQIERRREIESQLNALTAERRLLQQEQEQLQKQANEVNERRQEKAVVEANLAEATHRLEQRTRALDTIEAQAAEAQTVDLRRQSLEDEQKRLREDMDRLTKRISQLQNDDSSTCPLCGQNLTPEHRQDVVRELESEGKGRGDAYRANKVQLEQLQAHALELQDAVARRLQLNKEIESLRQRESSARARIDELDRALGAWSDGEGAGRLRELEALLADKTTVTQLADQLSELESVAQESAHVEQTLQDVRTREVQVMGLIERIEEAVVAWEQEGAPRLAKVEEALSGAGFAAEARAALQSIDDQLSTLSFDQEAFERSRATAANLAPARDRYQALKEAEAAVSPLREAVADLRQRRDSLQQQVAEQEAQHQLASAQLTELELAVGDWRTGEANVARLQAELSQADQLLGASRQRVLVLDDRKRQAKELRARRDELNLRSQRLQRLEDACSRKGIQALLIEHALPEIEEHANSLLDRLTGGEMRVTFETQRQLKSRDALTETLEIHIRDGSGERPYENYSGGEQFRVDFAIRLALSQVLAQRAGARLRTLVIDEGFGSQDPQGRQRLVEAINTVQTDFDCILVITHIAELRDAFPARIAVEKGPRGSTVEVNVF